MLQKYNFIFELANFTSHSISPPIPPTSPTRLTSPTNSKFKIQNSSEPPAGASLQLVPNSKFKIQNSKFKIQNSKFKIQNSKFKILLSEPSAKDERRISEG